MRYGTFVFKETKTLYLNGTPQFAGVVTLWIDYIEESAAVAEGTSWAFPSNAHPLLAFYAIGIQKGGIDFGDVNGRMAPDNRAQAGVIMKSQRCRSRRALCSVRSVTSSEPIILT
jgi:hypothetical protein